MAGPNLEIFRFGFYMFFPIYIMFKFGDPIWYDTYVIPYKDMFWPPYESTNQPPKTHTDLREELARMKAERIARKSALAGHPSVAEPHYSSVQGNIDGSVPVPASEPVPVTAEAAIASEALPLASETPAIAPAASTAPIASSASKWKWPSNTGSNASTSGSSGRLV